MDSGDTGARQARLWLEAAAEVNEAFTASAKLVLAAQADCARGWAERVAADPKAPKIMVEAAHQAYDLVVACTEAEGGFCDTWVAALRGALGAWQSGGSAAVRPPR